ncbi:hypothetical protein THRCLA_02786 [Thraustotheca clavata]|uniref:Uncharacterized protein n=1 Tax=Thraustotheca clavata TaxID=74557 RepID=A0A1W0A443_9STRA|nr:hypothetical protein THRCLA_02786 [Thraustotheca clavata]
MMMFRELSESKQANKALIYMREHAPVILGCIGLTGITLVLAHMEPWKLYLLACLGLVFLPVFLQQGYQQTHMNSTIEVIPEHHPAQKTTQIDIPSTKPLVNMPIVQLPRTLSPSVSLKEDPIISIPPLVLESFTPRKGLHIMSKDVLHRREQLFARAMTSIHSLSPRNQPVVHHLDLIKYAEEIDDQNEDNFI